MRKIKAQEAIEFILITALVFLGSLLVVLAFGKNISNFFTESSSTVKSSENESYTIDKNTPVKYEANYQTKDNSGSLGGTLDEPISKCNNNVCNIDFGIYTLSEIPQNISEVISTSGSSGGTLAMVNIIKQLATALETKGLTQQSIEIKKFASIGHNIATLEKEYEKIFNSCNKDLSCIKNKINGNVSLPEGYDDTFYPFTSINYSDFNSTLSVGVLKSNYYNNYASSLNNNYPGALFIDKYESLMKSDIDKNTKGILTEMYWQIGKLTEDVEAGLYYAKNDVYGQDYHDPITGVGSENPDLPSSPFEIFNGYKPSSLTHFDSSIICTAGKFKDSGKRCN